MEKESLVRTSYGALFLLDYPRKNMAGLFNPTRGDLHIQWDDMWLHVPRVSYAQLTLEELDGSTYAVIGALTPITCSDSDWIAVTKGQYLCIQHDTWLKTDAAVVRLYRSGFHIATVVDAMLCNSTTKKHFAFYGKWLEGISCSPGAKHAERTDW